MWPEQAMAASAKRMESPLMVPLPTGFEYMAPLPGSRPAAKTGRRHSFNSFSRTASQSRGYFKAMAQAALTSASAWAMAPRAPGERISSDSILGSRLGGSVSDAEGGFCIFDLTK